MQNRTKGANPPSAWAESENFQGQEQRGGGHAF